MVGWSPSFSDHYIRQSVVVFNLQWDNHSSFSRKQVVCHLQTLQKGALFNQIIFIPPACLAKKLIVLGGQNPNLTKIKSGSYNMDILWCNQNWIKVYQHFWLQQNLSKLVRYFQTSSLEYLFCHVSKLLLHLSFREKVPSFCLNIKKILPWETYLW